MFCVCTYHPQYVSGHGLAFNKIYTKANLAAENIVGTNEGIISRRYGKLNTEQRPSKSDGIRYFGRKQPVFLPLFHDDVIRWIHFPHYTYWPFVRGNVEVDVLIVISCTNGWKNTAICVHAMALVWRHWNILNVCYDAHVTSLQCLDVLDQATEKLNVYLPF